MQKVLICDDSAAELANLRTILSDAGWQSVTATNGEDAIRKAKNEKPALILLDIIMPDMDGFAACRALQSDPETKTIPIVFISSKSQKADHIWAKMQGGKALISKPYTAEQILDALKAFVAEVLMGLESRPFLDNFRPFQRRIARVGIVHSLSQVVLKLGSPGVPSLISAPDAPASPPAMPEGAAGARVRSARKATVTGPPARLSIRSSWPLPPRWRPAPPVPTRSRR